MSTGIAFVEQDWNGVAVTTRDLAGGLTLKQIDSAFEPIGYTIRPEHRPREEWLATEGRRGQRRARAQVWLERINWQANPPYGLYDALSRLAHIIDTEPDPSAFTGAVRMLNRELARHGSALDLAQCEVVPVSHTPQLATDLAGVALEIQRIERSIGSGDVLATIGAGKNLVEAAAKAVLTELGAPVAADDTVPALVARTHEALSLAAGSELPPALRTNLGSSQKVATSLGELRNATAGSGGHGAAEPAAWVQPEHARLVAESAVAWTRFILATYERRSQQ